ncbi:hypothetical protein SLE2022_075970 [Rubroshorea leprosula]
MQFQVAGPFLKILFIISVGYFFSSKNCLGSVPKNNYIFTGTQCFLDARRKKQRISARLLSVFSHILGLLDLEGHLTELLPSIPPAYAKKPISQASTDDFGAHRMKDTGKNAQSKFQM